MSYLLGLISKEKYYETTVSDSEVARAEDLLDGDSKPMTGFEIHFLRVMRGESLACTPKEIVLEKTVRANIRISSGFIDEEYDKEELDRDYENSIDEWHSNLGGGSLDRRDNRLIAAEYDAYRSSLISSYQDWLETDCDNAF